MPVSVASVFHLALLPQDILFFNCDSEHACALLPDGAERLTCDIIFLLSLRSEGDGVAHLSECCHLEAFTLAAELLAAALPPRRVIRLRQSLDQAGLARHLQFAEAFLDAFQKFLSIRAVLLRHRCIDSGGEGTLGRENAKQLSLELLGRLLDHL